jgi:anti-sigma-K factor RskA
MENTMTDTRPQFSRVIEGGSARSWRAAVPAVVVVVAFVALLGYLASKLSSSEQRALLAERDTAQSREMLQGMSKQIATLQKENALAKSPGRTTVIVEPGNKKTTDAPWAAATWGELPNGKSFMRAYAYGLGAKPEEGKAYHLWFTPETGEPIDLGSLEPDADGNAFVMGSELPPVDQGKAVVLTADAPGVKQPGDVIARADLPKLKPQHAAPPTADETPQAKSGTTSQQMHQQKSVPSPGK